MKHLAEIIGIIIIIIFVSGCTGNSNYTLTNSTFNISSDFQEGNVTTYNNTAYLTEMTFKLNGEEVLGVVQYPNAIEYAKGIKNPLYLPVTKNYTKEIGNTQVTVLEKEDYDKNFLFSGEDNGENYFFTKSGKYYSIVATRIGSTNSINRNKIEEAMKMIVETIK